jgi:hypothetical protein
VRELRREGTTLLLTTQYLEEPISWPTGSPSWTREGDRGGTENELKGPVRPRARTASSAFDATSGPQRGQADISAFCPLAGQSAGQRAEA